MRNLMHSKILPFSPKSAFVVRGQNVYVSLFDFTLFLVHSKLYVVQSAGSDDEEQEIIEVGDSRVAVFDPHPLQHLALLDDFNSLSPITDFLVCT